MFILHLFSNWKWTGPAEHAINLCLGLKKRGHRVVFASGRPPKEDLTSTNQKAQALGIETLELRLRKHLNLLDNPRDLWALARYIKASRPDVIHTHMTNDHLLAGIVAKMASPKIPVLRTSYEGEGLRPGLRNRFLLWAFTSGLIAVSERARERDMTDFGFPKERLWKIEVGVDTGRFDPAMAQPHLRGSWGIGTEEIVVGIVARIQWHRRFDIFLEAFRLAYREMPRLRAVIIGRGTNMVPVAVEPARRMGLNGKVVFPGYKEGDEYVEALASLDIKVFLVPGTDGSCRAVREAMAMGLPVIAARRGMLPEIVIHGETGLVIDDTPEKLSRAIIELASDGSLRRRMGEAARQRAVEEFSLEKEVKEVEAVYKALLGVKEVEQARPLQI